MKQVPCWGCSVCECVSCRSRSVLLITSKEFDFSFFNKTCYGHGAIQGYQHLVTPVITVASPREFEQFEWYCLYKKCSYYASTYIPTGPALTRAVRHQLLPAEEWFRIQASPYEIYGGLSVTGRGFSSGTSLFPLLVSFHKCSVAHSSAIDAIHIMFVTEISVQ
jgi:hypothetical protein